LAELKAPKFFYSIELNVDTKWMMFGNDLVMKLKKIDSIAPH